MSPLAALSVALPAAAPANVAGAAPTPGTPGEFARCMERASEPAPRPASDAATPADAAPDAATAEAAADEAADAESVDEIESDDDAPTVDAATPDLSLLLPGWCPVPTPAAASAAVGGALGVAVSVDVGTGPVAVETDVASAGAAIDALPAPTPRGDKVIGAPDAATRTRPMGPAADAAAVAPSPPASSSARDSAATAATSGAAAVPQTPADARPAPTDSSTVPTVMTTPTVAAPAPQFTAKAVEMAAATALVSAPIDTPAFAPALATQLRWWAADGVQQAQLQLNPAEMGPVAVRIVVDGREARIDFSADLPATRGALESALPVLAAALDESGLKLAGGGVHDGAAQRQAAWQAPTVTQRTNGGTGAPLGDAAIETGAHRGAPARGLVDLVA